MKSLVIQIKKSKYKPELLLAAVLMIATMCCLCYYDGLCRTVWSTNFLDCIAQGRIFDYYSYCAENNYGIPIESPGGIGLGIVLLSIWCLPIWGVQYFLGIEIAESVLCMIWARLYYVVILALVIAYVGKILRIAHYEDEQISLIEVLCATSVFVQISVSYAGQNDLLWIVFGVMGVFHYLSDDWKKFYLCSILSLLVKPYFFPVTILLVLFKEKDVLMIGKRICCYVAPYLALSFLFKLFADKQDQRTSNLTAHMLADYVNNAWLSPYGWVSIVVTVCILFATFAYFINLKNKKIEPDMVLFLLGAFYTIWFLIAGENFYRLVMLVPWIYMALFKDKRYNELLLWITTAYTYGFVLVFRFHETEHFFNIKNGTRPSLIPKSIIDNTDDFFLTISKSMGSTFNHIGYILNGIWVALSFLIVLLMMPYIRKKLFFEASIPNREWVKRCLLFINVIAIVLLDLTALISLW